MKSTYLGAFFLFLTSLFGVYLLKSEKSLMARIRRRLSPEKAQFLGLDVRAKHASSPDGNPIYDLTEDQLIQLRKFDNTTISTSTSHEYENKKTKPLILSAWNAEGFMMDIDEYCEFYALPRKDVSSYKLVSHTGTPFYNIVFREVVEDVENFDLGKFEEIIQKHLSGQKHTKIHPTLSESTSDDFVDRFVFTDVHVGMDPNKTGHSLYGGKWDGEEQTRRFNLACDKVLSDQWGTTLIVDDLGDFLDGWDGMTARKSHPLPQNMNNEKAFDTGLGHKISILHRLAPHYKNIIFNNICEDNHSASFGYVLNSAFKMIAEQLYSNVKVVNHMKFMQHYFIDNHAMIISHGKDSKNLKFGFKPKIDDGQIRKIDQYIGEHKLKNLSNSIYFSKGDSHLALFDPSSSDDFEYNNYPAFSPASEWIQTNFKKNKSGFVFEHIRKGEDEVTRTVYYFK